MSSMQKEVKQREKAAADASSEHARESLKFLEGEVTQLTSKLSATQKDLEEREMAIADAERKAQTAAEQLAKMQVKANATAQIKREAAAQTETLKRQLDELTSELSTTHQELEKVDSLKAELATAQAAAVERVKETQEESSAEAERLQNELTAAQAKAAEKENALAASESQIAELKKHIAHFKRALQVKVFSDIDKNEILPAKNGNKAVTITQTRNGVREIAPRPVLMNGANGVNRVNGANGANGVNGAKPALPVVSPPRLPLSKMKKAELMAECKERKLDIIKASVVQLRAILRVERDRDSMIQQLVDRGWSPMQSRRELIATEWDVDMAIDMLSR